jgi:hypothetical protein
LIWEILTGLGLGGTVINGIALILMYRQYVSLASESMEFAAMVVESIKEPENGNVQMDPLALATTSIDHINQFSGLLKWIRF